MSTEVSEKKWTWDPMTGLMVMQSPGRRNLVSTRPEDGFYGFYVFCGLLVPRTL